MSRWTRSLAVLATTAVLTVSGGPAIAQDTTGPDSVLRAQMAAITLDRANLPGDYRFQGETFLSVEQAAGAALDPASLQDAGFVSQYLSVYLNPDTGQEITTYVSAWTDAGAAEDGFNLLEDEATTQPDGTFSDSQLSLGESPSEVTTGTYPNPDGSGSQVGVVDATFRVDRFIVGVSLTTGDGSAPDAAVVESLAGTVESRATAVVGGQSPDGTSLDLAANVTPLFGLGQELQAGFLDAGDVETMYGLQGSALGELQASWVEVVGATGGTPYLAVGATSFGSVEDAQTVIDQLQDLSPELAGQEAIDGVQVSGADSAVAWSYQSPATGATENDSVRIFILYGTTVAVADVQGAESVEIAQEAALAIASAQAVCLGDGACEAPILPDGVTG